LARPRENTLGHTAIVGTSPEMVEIVGRFVEAGAEPIVSISGSVPAL
jgi:hypothetical protein